MQALELSPAIGWPNSKALRKFLRGFVELANDTFDGIRKDSQLLEEPGAVGKQHMVQKLVPVGGTLRSFAAKEFSIQGFD
ncbi:MAG TPA: hypothetical protein VN881_12040 [Candidatus Acidoferrales bacterium]|nr:hypothetical protein [Candidatus Acidoferrales bacterium]